MTVTTCIEAPLFVTLMAIAVRATTGRCLAAAVLSRLVALNTSRLGAYMSMSTRSGSSSFAMATAASLSVA